MAAEQKQKSDLTRLFEKLNQDFAEYKERYRFCVMIGGHKIVLYFPSKEQAAEAEKCFAGARIPYTPEPEARLYFSSDDCSRYVNNKTNERWRYREDGRRIISAPNRWMIAADAPNNTFYYCQHNSDKFAPIAYWRVSALVSQWAEAAELLPVHGAAVGAEGKGVLLIANGGGGKSTLAASCLLSGMDYAGDDYVLLSSQGVPVAMPLFSTLKMNQDMKRELKVDLPVIFEDAKRGGKQLLDASSFQICTSLNIYATVFINRADGDYPEISAARGSSSVRLAQSALRMEGVRDPILAKSVVQRLSKLPAYDMRLSRNLERNADALRAWIERME